MNKKEAEQKFRQEVMPTIKQEEQERELSHPDYERRERFWNKFLEIMMDGGQVSQEKANSWEAPPFCNSKYDPRKEKATTTA